MSTPDDNLVTVRILRLPLKLHAAAQQHSEEMTREFQLIVERSRQVADGVPDRLVALSTMMASRYAGFTDAQNNRIDVGIEAGDSELDELTFVISRHAGDAALEVAELLDDADEFCRQGRLLTLATPPHLVEYRRWYLNEFVAQAGGTPPTPWPGSFDVPAE